jgi:hypothetical protein
LKAYRHNVVDPVAEPAWVAVLAAEPAWVAVLEWAAVLAAEPAWVALLPGGSIELVRLVEAVSPTVEAVLVVPPVDLAVLGDQEFRADQVDPSHQDLAVDPVRTGIVGVPLLLAGG